MERIEKRFREALEYLSPKDQSWVLTALDQVKEWHEGQERLSGEPFVVHPIATAMYLAQLECGPETLVAGLFHDAVEDERATLEEIRDGFGEEVMKLVDAVTKLTRLRYEGGRSERQIASLRKMLLAASEDLRVIFIKLCDRLHNIETIEALRPDKQERIARETLDIYVPFARLVGLWWMKQRFEEYCFPIAFRREAEEWSALVAKRRSELLPERLQFFAELKRSIQIPVVVELIKKTDYELFIRCGRNISLLQESSIIDSVLVMPENPHADASACYRILGDIHQHFPVKSASFRDCIGQSFPNGYRALHTTVFLAYQHLVRLRIQTKEMHEYATMRKYSAWMGDRQNDLYRALGSLHQQYLTHDQYIAELKENVLKEKVSVFTPSGEIITLPRGANGIDLAFTLDPNFLTDLSGMRVNGEEREVTSELHDGDTVELTLLGGRWKQRGVGVLLRQRAKTREATEALREVAAKLPADQLKSDGLSILEHECQKFRLPVWWLLHLKRIQEQLCRACGEEQFDELLCKVGAGYIPAQAVMQAYRQALGTPSSLIVRLLKLCNLLPRSRILNPTSMVVQLEITSEDRPGMVHDVTRCFAERKVNIAKITAFATPPQDALYKITIEVDDFEKFSELYDALLQVPGVKSVLRTR